MIRLYNLLLYLYFAVTLPFYIIKLVTTEKYRVGLKQRLGFLGKLTAGKKILVHTVSVGEFLGALPLIDALERQYPAYKIIVSTTTLTGNRIAKMKLGNSSRVFFFPLDFRWAVKRFLEKLDPAMIVLMETEIWPNFLDIANGRNIPVVMVNGRVSERSFKNYMKVKGFFNYGCRAVKLWGVQFEDDKRRLAELGIAEKNIFVSGSLKIDSAVHNAPDEEDVERIKRDWGWGEDITVIAGGSTHPGEEKILLDIYRNLTDNFKNVLLILVPRHPERAVRLKRTVERYKLKGILRSEWQKSSKLADYNVILVDTMGDLAAIYTMATVVFIGKSLRKGGGQNILEPLVLGKPAVCGPLMGNFRDITKWLVKNKAIVQVEDERGLERIITKLIRNKKEASDIGSRARELVFKATGVVERNIVLMSRVFKG